MANIRPVDPESVPELAPVFERVEAVMGFVPNSVLTMARVPGLGPAFAGLAGPILRNDLLEVRSQARHFAACGRIATRADSVSG